MTISPHSADFLDNLTHLFRFRRDTRHFRSEKVAEDVLTRLLKIASSAPSVGLSQPWRFMRVESSNLRSKVRQEFLHCNAEALASQNPERRDAYAALKLAGLDDAPHHIAVFSERDPDQGHALGRATMPQTLTWSTIMAIHSFWLAAEAYGVGVGWVSILSPDNMARIFAVPESWEFVAYLCVGVPQFRDDVPELERRGWEQRQEDREQWIWR